MFKSSGNSRKGGSRSPVKTRKGDVPLSPFSSNYSVMSLKAKAAEQKSLESAQKRAELELADLFQQFKVIDEKIQKKCLTLDEQMKASAKKRDEALDEKYREMDSQLEEFTKKIKQSCDRNANVVSKINENIRKAQEAEAARKRAEEEARLKAEAEARAKMEAEARAKAEAEAKKRAEAQAQTQAQAEAQAQAQPQTQTQPPAQAPTPSTPQAGPTLQPGEFPPIDFLDPRWIPFIKATPKGKTWVVLSAFQEFVFFKDKYDSVAKCVELVRKAPSIGPTYLAVRGDIQNAMNALANSAEQAQQKVVMMNTILGRVNSSQEMYLSCLWTIADRLVVQAANQVARNPASAWSFAHVIQGIREAHPFFHYFMLGQFNFTCPWTVPMNPPKRKEMSEFDHKIQLLKYKKDLDDEGKEVAEGFAKYAGRMGGIISLFCCMLALPDKSGKVTFGPQLWLWFTRFLCLEARPASARILISALEVSNKTLDKLYGTQWHKLKIAMLEQYTKTCPTKQPEWSAAKTQLEIVLREMCGLE